MLNKINPSRHAVVISFIPINNKLIGQLMMRNTYEIQI
jgi:hypothetical protein